MIVTSQMLLSVLAAIVLPSRSFGSLTSPSAGTSRSAHGLLPSSPPSTPWETICSGRSFERGDQQRDGVREADVEVAAEHRRRDRGAARRELRLEGELLLLEEALLDAEEDRRDVGDRDQPDLQRLGLRRAARLAGVLAAVVAAARRQQRGNTAMAARDRNSR